MARAGSLMLFVAVVGAVALLRLVELAISRRNLEWLRARGGVESGASHYPLMVALHAAWLVAAPAEVWIAHRPFVPALAAAMSVVLATGMGLRWWAMASLGQRWCTRVVVVPGMPLARNGPYRWLRHPNYLGVELEMVSLPLIHGAWLTAVVFGVANGLLLCLRIRVEDAALRAGAQEEAPVGGGSPEQ